MVQNMNTFNQYSPSHTDSSEACRAKEESGENVSPPNPEVSAKPTRRSFTAKYKLSIVEQADACRGSGEIGALLRREGLYSSHLNNWRKLHRQGALQSLSAQPRGPKAESTSVDVKVVAQLERKVAQLESQLDKAHTIIDVQKKLSVLLSNEPQQEKP